MPNILTKPELLKAAGDAVLYTVYQGNDYYMSLATLLKLITKTTVGLDQVDNTSDVNKPISQLQQQALDLKADKSAVPTLAAFNILAQEMQNTVTKDELDALSQQITSALINYATKADVTSAVQTAVTTLNTALTSIQTTLQAQAQNIATLQTSYSGFVTSNQMTAQLNQLQTSLTTNFQNSLAEQATATQSLSDALAALSSKVQMLADAQTQFTTLLAGKADKVHTHLPSDIIGLDTYITNIVNSSSLFSIGKLDW